MVSCWTYIYLPARPTPLIPCETDHPKPIWKTEKTDNTAIHRNHRASPTIQPNTKEKNLFRFPIPGKIHTFYAKYTGDSVSRINLPMQSESEFPPALQHADTDGGPPVKRRRPALSCAECRKRKVKCDRGKPCGPCSKTKSPTCTYRSYREERRTGPSSCASRVDGDGGVRSSGPVSSTSNNDVVTELKDRLRYLEEQLAAVHMGETRSFTGTSQPLRDPSNWQPSTYFVKSKFFGESHWLNCIEPVSLNHP